MRRQLASAGRRRGEAPSSPGPVPGDGGAFAIGIVLALCIILLTFTALLMIPTGAAIQDRARAQTAADAAALAGAEAIASQLTAAIVVEAAPPGELPPGEVPPGELPPGEVPPGEAPPADGPLQVTPGDVASGAAGSPPPVTPASGAGDAAALAAANGAEIVTYTVSPETGLVYVQVRRTDAYDGPVYASGDGLQPSEAEATAQLPVDVTTCQVSQASPMAPTADGVPRASRTLRCGDWVATYELVLQGGQYQPDEVVDAAGDPVTDPLQARLVE